MLTMVKDNAVAVALLLLSAIVGYTALQTHTADFEAEARREFIRIHKELEALDTKVDGMSEDVAVLRANVGTLTSDVQFVRRFLLQPEQAMIQFRGHVLQTLPASGP